MATGEAGIEIDKARLQDSKLCELFADCFMTKDDRRCRTGICPFDKERVRSYLVMWGHNEYVQT